ncbi:thioredoxin-dependent thiol peroxidase [Helicobacter winghamensis]|uniref:Putative peroxiredoxin bcp n=1 Tax=Helicobacter winghamensis TaxID=157268 RepID=A0A2N3PH79_9HELI|nr:thioredoxin-dependent thiol peroxidase [Helicobacter winghamensis]EEO26592.1 putative peroxiredoxin bcp [Helicobacter winghamensis ATCC BAA-430]PKT75360.1 peroxiredoxin [Helicobacter winghamensis]PKT75528.1 peroxiredoxin [Helicobacter winghamensis]PKT79077.1 peroxiredoxin [Helicobacter winghamensis]PKT79742.1 peroxiredoxin [Helicobacter winghamensis]
MELKINEEAPLFSLPNQDNAEISLRDFRGSFVVLYFYPKDKTPGCTTEACDFRDSIQSFNKLNAVVLGVSPDSVKSHQSFIEKERLNFTLLSDNQKVVLKSYGAWGLKKLYGKEYEGVIRSTFIINPEGKIAFFWKNVKINGHIEAIKEKLKELGA